MGSTILFPADADSTNGWRSRGIKPVLSDQDLVLLGLDSRRQNGL